MHALTANRKRATLVSAPRMPLQLAVFLAISMMAAAQISTVALLKPGDSVPMLNGIRMVDTLRGWANSSGGLWSTTDGGATWKSSSIGAIIPASSWGVATDGRAWGFITSPKGDSSVEAIKVNSGGGVERRSTPCSPKIGCFSGVGAFSIDGQKGLFAGIIEGDPEHDKTRGYRTNDGGRTWTELQAFPPSIYRGDVTIVLTGETRAAMITGCDFYITADLGDTWTKAAPAHPAEMCSGTSNPYNIRFQGSESGWLRTDDGWILQSADGGTSWRVSSLRRQTIFFPKQYDSWVSFSDEMDGLSVIQGQLFLTRDGGRQWTTIPSNGETFAGVSCAGKRCVISSDRRISEFIFR